MDEEEDSFGGELFEDWGELRPGRVVPPLGGKIRYRQGADAVNWRTPGGQKYLPRDWQIQCGSIKDEFAAATFGAVEVEFPVAFADNPLFIAVCTGTWPAFEKIYEPQIGAVNPGKYDIYWWSINNLTKIYFNWLAIGPIGLNV